MQVDGKASLGNGRDSHRLGLKWPERKRTHREARWEWGPGAPGYMRVHGDRPSTGRKTPRGWSWLHNLGSFSPSAVFSYQKGGSHEEYPSIPASFSRLISDSGI